MAEIGTTIRNETLHEIDFNYIGETERNLMTIVSYRKR